MDHTTLLGALLATAALSNTLLALSIVDPARRFWPLAPETSWRHALMRVVGPINWISLIGIAVLGVLDWNSLSGSSTSRLALGSLVFAAGGAFALWGVFGLGMEASQGQHVPLVARGAYRYSRNPQYVGTLGVLLGFAVLANSASVWWAATAWSCWYILAPFAEEPWLCEYLGQPFADYMTRVRRFL